MTGPRLVEMCLILSPVLSVESDLTLSINELTNRPDQWRQGSIKAVNEVELCIIVASEGARMST